MNDIWLYAVWQLGSPRVWINMCRCGPSTVVPNGFQTPKSRAEGGCGGIQYIVELFRANIRFAIGQSLDVPHSMKL